MANFVEQSAQLQDDNLGKMVKASFCHSDFNYTRPPNADDGHRQEAKDQKLNSEVTLEATLEEYITPKIQKRPAMIRELSEHALSKISRETLHQLPASEKEYYLKNCGTVFHWDAKELSNFLKNLEVELRVSLKQDSYRLSSSILSLLTRQQLEALGQHYP